MWSKAPKGLVIAGPTCTGKSALAVELAKILGAEVISCDSAQVYKGLDIGTAKITTDEMQGMSHHMIDVATPDDKYDVGRFTREVNDILRVKEQENKPVILVGGTGLYIDGVTKGLAELPARDENIRAELSEYSSEKLMEMLTSLDSDSAENIHISNRGRIIRAIEVCQLTGSRFSILSRQNKKDNNYNFVKFALDMERSELYRRTDTRVEQMMVAGLRAETESLLEAYGESFKALNIIGYREMIDNIENNLDIDETCELIQKNTRHYVKRQFTWFRNDDSYTWCDALDNPLKHMLNMLQI